MQLFSHSRIVFALFVVLLGTSCGIAPAADPMHVTIIQNGLELKSVTTRTIVGEVLRDGQIDVYPEDLVIPDLTEPITDNQTIYIYPSTPVIITNFWGEEYELRTRAKTVGGLMDEIGFVPSEEKTTHPSLDTSITTGMNIDLIQKQENETETEVEIPFKTKYVRDDTKDYSYREITQPGKKGRKKKHLQLTYENGELVDRQITSEEVIEEPTEEVITIGTQTPPGGTKLGTVKASFYGGEFDGHRTASGETFKKDGLTAAHRTLPFGALVKVTNVANGQSVVVRITDRGPYSGDRGIDLSEAAFSEISHLGAGVITVELEVVNQ